MTAPERALFERAFIAVATGDTGGPIDDLFTEDVSGWSPIMNVKSRDQLEQVLADRDQSFTNVTFIVDTFSVIEDKGKKLVAEWRVHADHTGTFWVGEFMSAEPTGRRITLAGATFVDLRDGKICGFRTYFDDAAFLEQLLITQQRSS